MYAIKFNDKYYVSKEGLLTVTKNIYNAQLFANKGIARKNLTIFLKDYELSEGWEAPDDGPDSFKIVEVEMREVSDVSTMTQNMYEILTKIQNGAYARPLTGMSPRSPRYTKIVNGKLVTVYHAIGNEERVLETREFNIEDEGKTYEWVE